MMKTYARPTLVDYGTIETVTLGANGTLPDYEGTIGDAVLINNNCDASPPATACLTPPGS